jgi:hypothetical protein
VALLREFNIVDIAAAAGDKSRIFDAGNGLTDTELVHVELLRCLALLPRRASLRGGGEALYSPTAAMRME